MVGTIPPRQGKVPRFRQRSIKKMDSDYGEDGGSFFRNVITFFSAIKYLSTEAP